MQVSQKVKYGIACLNELSKHPVDFQKTEKIALQLKIPPFYAHKILQRFSTHGLIDSMRGRGYRLSRSTSDIELLEVMDVLSEATKKPIRHTSSSQLIEMRIRFALKGLSIDKF